MPKTKRKEAQPLLNGQWLGRYEGTVPGFILINLDDLDDHFSGTAFITPDPSLNPSIHVPTTVAIIKTPDKSLKFNLQSLALAAMNPRTHLIDSVENVLAVAAPGALLPKSADIQGEIKDGKFHLTWKTDQNLVGTCALSRSDLTLPSPYSAAKLTWNKFKARFSGLQGKTHIFRGQSTCARLCTKFHRAGRVDLTRFIQRDIPTLYKRLSARTKHVFRLTDPDETGAFYNLAQHHGYPTPLLDWTASPFVAAFFAYRGITSAASRASRRGDKVRIFVFDYKKWHDDFNPVWIVNAPTPNLTVAEFIAIENERMIPQQAVSTATNVVDIEEYIRSREQNGKTYLEVVELPVHERDLVLHELSVMGITAGSLFPGLDGACEELREQFFRI
jgi:hypothetical protein